MNLWRDSMKSIERLLIKLIIIQFICLLAFQAFLHQEGSLLESKKLIRYEGVTSTNHEKVVETFNRLNDE